MFSDKFLDQSNVETMFGALEISTTCRLFWDIYHITSEIWPETFGKAKWQGDFKEGMMGMIHAESEEQFQAKC